MRFSFSEFVLVFAIALALLGPTVIPRIQRFYQRKQAKRNNRAAARNAQREAALAQKRAFQFKCKVVLYSVLGAAVLASGLYLAFWPVQHEAQPYQIQSKATATTMLEGKQIDTSISTFPYWGAIQIKFHNDWIYAATHRGEIIRVRENGTGITEVLSMNGEITSFDFDAEDNIIFTSTLYQQDGGALLKASFDGFAVTVEPLLLAVNDKPLSCPTAVTVATDGTVYFLNATSVSAFEEGGVANALRTEFLAHTASGALYAYTPSTGEVEEIASGFAFASSLALSPEEDQIYVTELCGAAVWQVETSTRGAKLGEEGIAVFCKDLPAYPAGVSVTPEGDVLLSFLGGQNSWREAMCGQPALRDVLLRLPRNTREKIIKLGDGIGRFAVYQADGTLNATYQTKEKSYPNGFSSAMMVGNRIYLAQGDKSEWIGYYTAE